MTSKCNDNQKSSYTYVLAQNICPQPNPLFHVMPLGSKSHPSEMPPPAAGTQRINYDLPASSRPTLFLKPLRRLLSGDESGKVSTPPWLQLFVWSTQNLQGAMKISTPKWHRKVRNDNLMIMQSCVIYNAINAMYSACHAIYEAALICFAWHFWNCSTLSMHSTKGCGYILACSSNAILMSRHKIFSCSKIPEVGCRGHPANSKVSGCLPHCNHLPRTTDSVFKSVPYISIPSYSLPPHPLTISTAVGFAKVKSWHLSPPS